MSKHTAPRRFAGTAFIYNLMRIFFIAGASLGSYPSVAEVYYLTIKTGGHIGGIDFKNEDILKFDTNDKSGGANGTWSIYFDGSDVGLSPYRIDDFFIDDSNGYILLNFGNSAKVMINGKKTRIGKADIVKFIPSLSSTGDNTEGTFEWYFEGSSVGLKRAIDALTLDDSGNLILSIQGRVTSLTNGLGQPFTTSRQDLIKFNGTTGTTTSGNFELFFDGAKAGLNRASEDINGFDMDSRFLYLSTRGNFGIGSVQGTKNDILRCDLQSPPLEACNNALIALSVSDLGLNRKVINGFQLQISINALNDDFTTGQNTPIANGNLFIDNGHGADYDPNGNSFSVTRVNDVPANVGTQITLNSGALLSVQSSGIFSYEPNKAFDYLGSSQQAPDSFTYRITDSVTGDFDDATVTITINGINDTPLANDDSYAVEVNDTLNATSVLLNDTDADHNTLTAIVAAGPSHAASFNFNSDGTFSYTPTSNYNGSDSFTYKANDGATDSNVATVNIDVFHINAAPSFIKGADLTVNEDAGPQTIAGWATAISPGPASESGQTVNFNITGNSNPGLFSAAPAVAPDGALTYTPAANANGSATLTLTLQDNGGTANGGSDTSAPQQFTITVNAVNDAPSFTKGADLTVLEDAGAQTVAAWATSISAGPADEAGQTLTFQITNNTNPSLLSAGPAVALDGTLTYTPAANANGSATISLVLQDNGGTANGGVDTSAAQSFVINVTPVDDPPAAVSDAGTVNEDSVANAIDVLANDTDIDGGPKSIAIVTQPSNGTVVITGGGTGLTYSPAANYCNSLNGFPTDNFTYTLTPGGSSASVAVTVHCTDDAPVAQTKTATAQANMKITSLGGTAALTAGVTDADHGVSGCSSTFSVADVVSGTNGTVSNFNAGSGTFDFEPAAGFTGTATALYTVSDDGCPTSATSASATINITVNGPVVWFVDPTAGSNGSGTLSSPFNSLGSADTAKGTSTSHRIFVYSGNMGSGGSVSLTGDTTQTTAQWLVGQGATGASFDAVMGITPPTGTIARPAIGGTRPTILGTLTLNGNNVKAQGFNLSTGTSTGINDAASSISGVSVSEVSVDTTTGTAVNLSSFGGTVSLTSVSSNGAASGILLNSTTGSFAVTGDAGSANNSSGGTIQNATAAGISLTNAQNISLDQMNIQTTGDSGINGTQVTNFSFSNGTINNSGNAQFESNISFNGLGTANPQFGNNISGTLTVTGSTLTNAYESGLEIQSDNGTVSNATISNNVITSSTSAANSHGDGIKLVGTGNASTVFNLTKATISNNVITNFPSGGGIQVNIGNSNASGTGATAGDAGSATNIISITGNTIQGQNSSNRMNTSAIIVTNSGGNPGSRTQTNFEIKNHSTLTNITGTAILIGNNGYSTMTGVVDNNIIVANNTLASPGIGGGNGVSGAGNAWTPDLTLTVTNNNISQTDGNGILLVGRGTSGIAKFGIRNNTVAAPLGGVREGIRVDAGNASSVDDAVCLSISGNTSAGSTLSPNTAAGIGLRKQGTVATTNDFGIVGLSPSPTGTPDVENFVNSQNPNSAFGNYGVGGTDLISATSGFTSCNTAPQ